MRADLYLFKAGYAKSREAARKSIEAGLVCIDGIKVPKPAADVDITYRHSVKFTEVCDFVGRGGIKLDFALNAFGLSPEGCVCADIGASTGGFTDCLLRHGAEKVYAVDAGHGQLAKTLLENERVINLEGCNARNLGTAEIPEPLDFCVMDVSFISQTLIIPALVPLCQDSAVLVTLIKPQFEAGKRAVGKGGIVKKAADRYAAALHVKQEAEKCGLYMTAFTRSPVTGGDGNVEYLAAFSRKETVFLLNKDLFE